MFFFLCFWFLVFIIELALLCVGGWVFFCQKATVTERVGQVTCHGIEMMSSTVSKLHGAVTDIDCCFLPETLVMT